MQPRPIALTIFGILNIGFGLFDFASLMLSKIIGHANVSGNALVKTMQSAPAYAAWNRFSACITGVFGLVLLTAGIGLLLTQNWARILSIVYAVTAAIFIMAGSVVSYPFVQATLAHFPAVPAGMIGALTLMAVVFGTLLGLAYPVLLLIFMTRPKIIAAFGPEPPPA